jgi:hypothetical protein
MCIILAKFLPDLGWVGAKNRDRSYYPVINIKKSRNNGIERILLWDETTKYTEGLNENGVSIISSSMATVSDEKGVNTTHEGTRSDYTSPDGKKIRNALLERNCLAALESLIKHELTGHTFVFNADRCWLLESSHRNGEFVHKVEEISKDHQCVRTNHGILLPWAGYQRVPGDPSHSRKRVSSEVRKIKAELGLNNARTLDECMECILDHSDSNPQLNPCRLDDRSGYISTSGQVGLVPSQLTLYYRPVWSGITFDYDKLNNKEDKCFFEVLSQRPLHKN